MKSLFLIILLSISSFGATFTEFYAQATASNLNAGSTTNDASTLTYASGNWVQGTGVFTVASGDPAADGVAVGDWASVYADGSTVTGFIGRVTARDTTTITVSLAAIAGTAPADGTGDRTLKIGGAWKGPNATEDFPFSFAISTMTNSSGNIPRVNMKGQFDVTAAIAHTTGGVVWQGYTNTVGDGGRAIIDGGEVGAAYALFTPSGFQNHYEDIHWSHNGATGGGSATPGVNTTGNRNFYYRCVVSGMRGAGFNANVSIIYIECEAYDNNRANVTALGGFRMPASGSFAIRCWSHDNTAGANAHGFIIDQTVAMIGCISNGHTGSGIFGQGDQNLQIINCDVYDNGRHGFESAPISGTLFFNIQNCNFIDNTLYGIWAGSTTRWGVIFNCGFGSGTAANGSGEILAGLSPVVISGNVTYPTDLTPWVDPTTGDFRINLSQAKNAGRGNFLQTSGGSGTIGYPDIGAAQAQASAGSGGSFVWAQ